MLHRTRRKPDQVVHRHLLEALDLEAVLEAEGLEPHTQSLLIQIRLRPVFFSFVLSWGHKCIKKSGAAKKNTLQIIKKIL